MSCEWSVLDVAYVSAEKPSMLRLDWNELLFLPNLHAKESTVPHVRLIVLARDLVMEIITI